MHHRQQYIFLTSPKDNCSKIKYLQPRLTKFCVFLIYSTFIEKLQVSVSSDTVRLPWTNISK